MSAPDRMPRRPLIGLCLFIGVSIVTICYARFTRMETVHVPRAAAIATADIRFADLDDGSVRVTAAPDDRVVATLAPQTNAFIRTVMRGLVTVRKRAGIGPELPFRLERAPDSHLSLLDPTTGRRIELIGFGQVNADAFARLMPTDVGGHS